MKKLLFLVLLGFAAWHFYQKQSKSLAFDAQGQPLVWLFVADVCGEPCDLAAASLRRRGVPFQNFDVDVDAPKSDNYKRWLAVSSDQSVPKFAMDDLVFNGYGEVQLGSALGQVFGTRYLSDPERTYYAKHFVAGKPAVMLYGASWCPGCKALKEDYRAAGIAFSEVDVEQAPDRTQLAHTMGIAGYPAVWVGYQRIDPDLASTRSALKGAGVKLQ
jgi:glutaredoxin